MPPANLRTLTGRGGQWYDEVDGGRKTAGRLAGGGDAYMQLEQESAERCEESCTGTETDLAGLKRTMVSGEVAGQMADLFKALGDATRVRLIYALLDRELCVHDLSELLDMGQSAVSHQLRYLRNMRIVKRRKAGKTVYYSLDDSHIEQIFVQTLQHLQHP